MMNRPLIISRRVTWEDWHLLLIARNRNREFFFDKAAISPLTHHRFMQIVTDDVHIKMFVIDCLFENGSIRPVGLYGFKQISARKKELTNVHRIYKKKLCIDVMRIGILQGFQLLRRSGIDEVKVQIVPGNLKAKALYQRLDFSFVSDVLGERELV